MHDSDHKIINCGVHQGSFPEPLLFALYINDTLMLLPYLSIMLFADIVIFSPRYGIQNEIIDKELQEICHWFQAKNVICQCK